MPTQIIATFSSSFLAHFLGLGRLSTQRRLAGARRLPRITHSGLSAKRSRKQKNTVQISRREKKGAGLTPTHIHRAQRSADSAHRETTMETLEERYSESEEEEEEEEEDGGGREDEKEISTTGGDSTARRRSGTPGSSSGATNGGLVVLITGGNGRLGREIARLVYERWPGVQEIRLLDMIPPQQAAISGITGYGESCGKPRVSYCPYDVTKVEDLRVCFAKVHVVIHCAALMDDGSLFTRRRMTRVNVEGTRNVIDACLDCGVKALVFTGTMAQVYTSSIKSPVRFDESFEIPRNAELLFPHYGGSKGAAEVLVLEANQRRGKDRVTLHTCSLRLPPLYGECDANLILSGLRMAKYSCGLSLHVGTRHKTMQSLYSGNAAWAHVLTAQRLIDDDTRENIGGNFYYIGDDSPAWSLGEYHRQFLKPFGYRRIPYLRVPIWLLMIVAYLLEFLAILLSLVNIHFGNSLTRASVRWLDYSHSYTWERARRELGYEPLFDRSAALARSVEYYRQRIL